MAYPNDSDDISDRTTDLLGLADVERWCVVRTIRPQSVAEHAFAVAAISMELLDRLDITCEPENLTADVLAWALVHDAPETFTGDINGKFKHAYPSVADAISAAEDACFPWYARLRERLDDVVEAIVKVADLLETIMFIRTWGHGERADDVKRELEGMLQRAINRLAECTHQSIHETNQIVWHIRDHSTSESNSIQMRRHRNVQAP